METKAVYAKDVITSEEYRKKIKETGKEGLNAWCADFDKKMHKLYPDRFYFYRNQQGIGNKKGRPDRELIFRDCPDCLTHPAMVVFVELKSPKGKLRPDQVIQVEKLKAIGADVRVIDNREDYAQIFRDYGLKVEFNF